MIDWIMQLSKEITPRLVFLAMKRYGGSFASRLGDAGLNADPLNQELIIKTWPVIWEYYSEAAKQDLDLKRAPGMKV